MVWLQEWKKILDSVQIDNSSNKYSILKKIKENLKDKDLDTYKEWKRNNFDINHLFNIACDYDIELNPICIKQGLI